MLVYFLNHLKSLNNPLQIQFSLNPSAHRRGVVLCVQVLEITQELRVNLEGSRFSKNLEGRKHTFQKYNPLHNKRLLSKAGEAIRTPDIHVGNVTMCIWSRCKFYKCKDLQQYLPTNFEK